ncbi:MAG: hypothetical protein O7H41_17180 [Planctomycetota bacterium]|nr:hypothetical protein [Planctomycetota bacterium]
MIAKPPLLPALGLLALLSLGTSCQTTVGNYLGNRGRDLGDCFRLQVGFGPGVGASASAGGNLHLGLAVAAVPRSLGVGWVYGEGNLGPLGPGGNGWDGVVDYSLGMWVGVFIAAASGAGSHSAGAHDPSRGYRMPGFHWQIDGHPHATLSPSYAQHACYSFLPVFLSRVGPRSDAGQPSRASPERSDDWRSGEVDPEAWSPDGTDEAPSSIKPLHWREHPIMWSGRALRLNRRAHIHAFDIEASVYAGMVYARAGFSPGEFVDFLLGWFGVDIAGDDRPLEAVQP